jgi:uncharacterized protein with NRDE domain
VCTVTFLPSGESDFILTSNRDEQQTRKPALPPQTYLVAGKSVIFPKDTHANGTWIATDKQAFTLCLLNGAFEFHTSNPPYRISRGLMLLDFFKFNEVEAFVKNYDFSGIEPFTLLIIGHESKLQLTEIRFDAFEKMHIFYHNVTKPLLWSSATLYPEAVRQQRRQWFERWLSKQKSYELENILHFHHFGGSGDEKNDLLMNRQSVFTVSITAVVHQNQDTEMIYEAVEKNDELNDLRI